MQKASYDIVIFLVVVSGLLLFLIAFIVSILYLYRKKQQSFEQNLEQLKLDHEKTILNTQLEIQEQTFQHISREIHDNISLSLTLAKLQLNTLNWDNKETAQEKVESSVALLSRSIGDLSDISKSLNANIITEHGLLNAIDDEIKQLQQAQLFTLNYSCTGNPVFMEPQTELIIFRIIQESFNNIIKHAHAKNVSLQLHYNNTTVTINITDDGIGFDNQIAVKKGEAGLKNIQSRAKTIGGTFELKTVPSQGTSLTFTIPYSLI
ncbi:MAG: ATP-binding protein [Chitinophagaceae bacterium]